MQLSLLFLLQCGWIFNWCWAAHLVPVLMLDTKSNGTSMRRHGDNQHSLYITLTDLVGDKKDTRDFWQMAEVLPLLKKVEASIDYTQCDETGPVWKPVRFPASRRVMPVCNAHSLVCPTCPQLDNYIECELFRDSCKERRVKPEEYLTYCDQKYGRWRTMFVPADYSACRCCDECIFYREMDQSCIPDELHFEIPESMPVSTLDFRADCNPYLGHPNQELKALRCDKELRRCVPVSLPSFNNPTEETRRRNRPEVPVSLPPPPETCPASCKNFRCPKELTDEFKCPKGSFLPEKNTCNCCGHCSRYQQLGEICALFKRTEEFNGTQETEASRRRFRSIAYSVHKYLEVEEEFIEPGCDHGLVCRFGICQDIHAVEPKIESIRRVATVKPYEPCRKELRQFKVKYGADGHLHYNAPQCTPLWLYAPVQCRRFVCHCAMEDGTIIRGTKTPRVEVSNMNCDCAREKCRSGRTDLECDGYGNYKETKFVEDRGERIDHPEVIQGVVARVTQADVDSSAKNELWDVNYR